MKFGIEFGVFDILFSTKLKACPALAVCFINNARNVGTTRRLYSMEWNVFQHYCVVLHLDHNFHEPEKAKGKNLKPKILSGCQFYVFYQ